jgi:hypothetical protein
LDRFGWWSMKKAMEAWSEPLKLDT